MSAKRKTTVGVIFGGRSVEHDVSIVTGHQVMKAFDKAHYDIVPIYITRDGKWYTGEPLMHLDNYIDEIISHKGVQPAILSPGVQHHGLIINPIAGRLQKSEIKRLDIIFPTVHGSHGEDGTLQGLFELADIPYVGCGVLGSAIANDKQMTKQVLQSVGIPVVDGIAFTRAEWLTNREGVLARIKAQVPYPLFVKPATLGSSIGVSHVADDRLLQPSIDVAVSFDRRVIVEIAVANSIEINCAVMGNGEDIHASVLEQPISWQDFLTYEDKYMRGSGGMKSQDRIIPAPLSDQMTEAIKTAAINGFKAIDGRGTARIDFLVNVEEERIFLNEINTMPGSLAFYLWQELGMSNQDVVNRLLQLAQDAFSEKRRSTYDYHTSLVELTASRGLKGAKGTKSI